MDYNLQTVIGVALSRPEVETDTAITAKACHRLWFAHKFHGTKVEIIGTVPLERLSCGLCRLMFWNRYDCSSGITTNGWNLGAAHIPALLLSQAPRRMGKAVSLLWNRNIEQQSKYLSNAKKAGISCNHLGLCLFSCFEIYFWSQQLGLS